MIISPFLSFESLLQNLTDGLRKMPRGLTPYRVVVPSVHLRDWIQIQIAKRLGICMGFQFSTPQDFVLEVFRTAGIPRAEHWMKRHMEWAILEGASANASLLPAMPPGCSVRDRFAMARAVADRFDQYAHYRPEMIEAWSSGKSYLPNHAEEAWQRGLWAMLHASAKNDDGLLPGRLKASPDLAKAIPSVLVIGSGSLDPLLVDVLLRLQPCGCEVDVRIVLPCLGFLEDLRKKTLQTPSRIPEEGDPESFEFHQDLENNPLLVSMGRQAAGAFVLLGKLDEQYSNWDEQFPGTPPATLLGHLQRGGSPTALDRILGIRFGVKAVSLIKEGLFGHMVSYQSYHVGSVPIEKAVEKLRNVDPNGELVTSAKAIGISFGHP
jgi:exonuclease V gamma subunit